MSLKSSTVQSIPEETMRVARAAFPHGNAYLTLRDALGTIFTDTDFAPLFPSRGQPGLAPWRLALVTIMQFRENLADRQAAEAVRARIDWKYLLGLELTDPGFDFSVLSEFRDRLLAGSAEARLLDLLLERCRTLGLLKARGQQRTDSPHVLAAIRVLSRLELVAETLRAVLNDLATVAPDWLQALAPVAWYERYGKRIEDTRLPRAKAAREAYAQTIGEDGLRVLEAVEAPDAPEAVRTLPSITTLRRTWQRHYAQPAPPNPATRKRPGPRIRWKTNREWPRAAEGIESPYDPEARYRHKRDTQWTGYMVHVSETCEPTVPHLITHVHTTAATVHEVQCTTPSHAALLQKALAPAEHLVDAAYIDAELLVKSQEQHGITLRGPTRPIQGWQAQVEGGYTIDQFEVDWAQQRVRCPQGKWSAAWWEHQGPTSGRPIWVQFALEDCQACPARARCTRAQQQGRRLGLPPRAQYEAVQAARAWIGSEAGQQQYQRRAGVEGTLSQAVRSSGLRYARYWGAAKTHVQHVATAAALNIDRLVAWRDERPRAKTRTSRFAALAPVCIIA
jgi:transposase